MHPLAKVRGDVDQRVKREARDAAPQRLIDARLCNAAMLGRFKLRPAILLNQCCDFVCHSFVSLVTFCEVLRGDALDQCSLKTSSRDVLEFADQPSRVAPQSASSRPGLQNVYRARSIGRALRIHQGLTTRTEPDNF